MDEELIYWIWLQQRLGFGARGVSAVLEQPGRARYVYELTKTELRLFGMFGDKAVARLADKRLSDAEAVLSRCEKLGYSVVTPGDPRYPDRLRNIASPPAVLYVSGTFPAVDSEVCVGVVGTRSASQFGTAAAQELGRHLAEAGAIVVSGAAAGIDTAAHQGALMAKNGRTIAVLGCGIDYPYNMKGKSLRECIARSGAVVSEYPPGTEPYSANFPIRNRLISGMSLGVAVIEAGTRSGSLITANLAAEQGRDVFAVPGRVGDSRSQGCNQLLRDGVRELVSPADILREYAPSYPHRLSLNGHDRPLMERTVFPAEDIPASPPTAPRKTPPKKAPAESRASAEKPESPAENIPDELRILSAETQKIYSALRSGPQPVDELAAATGIPPETVLRSLTELEIYSLVKALPGRRYSL